MDGALEKYDCNERAGDEPFQRSPGSHRSFCHYSSVSVALLTCESICCVTCTRLCLLDMRHAASCASDRDCHVAAIERNGSLYIPCH